MPQLEQRVTEDSDLGLDVAAPKKFGLTLLLAVFGVFRIVVSNSST
jgi:hypothetical protein